FVKCHEFGNIGLEVFFGDGYIFTVGFFVLFGVGMNVGVDCDNVLWDFQDIHRIHIMRNRMVYQNILLETNDGISLLTINRPDKRNALNQATRDEILHALDTLQSTPESRVLVVTGAGDKAFIAGADIGEFAGKTAITQREAMKGRRAFDAVEDFPKPV